RHEGVVIHALAERLALTFADADHTIDPAVDADLLVDGIHTGQEVIHNIRSDDNDVGVVPYIDIVDHASGGEVDIQNWHHGGCHAANDGIADGLLAIFNVSAIVAERGSYPFAVLAGFEDRFVVLHGEIFALLALEHNKDVSAQIENLGRDVAFDAVDEGDHGNHGGHSDDHAKQGERGAQFV